MKFVVVFITLFLVCYTHSYKLPTSCKQIKQMNSRATSRLYIIKPVPFLSPLIVYCEMAISGGGFTFLPRGFTRKTHANLIVNALFTERKNVLLKLQQFGGHKESYTLIKPLHAYKHYNFGVRVNSYTGYTPPVNRFMHDYILLGIIPKHVAAQRSIQGFISNGHYVQFRNCDGNPNSLFAFLPNHRHQTPSSYHASNTVYERRGVAVDWRKTASPIHHPVRVMPNEFFFLTELHFGGCGTYTSSDRWKDYRAAAIGLR
ncbi:uncharacterized protein LOC110061763 isoform X2 [Orbicella faveolata]|nr:uncharacterized protein LOC110061763 isoform X2 [Orbicella faveolata]